MKKYLLFLPLMFLVGCAYLHSTTTRATDPKTGIVTEKTVATGYALFDANSQLMRFRNQSAQSGTNSFAPGTYVQGLNETSSTSNVVNILNALGSLAGQAAAAAAK